MSDEERLHMITEQLLIVRDNLFRGMSKSIQKLQARSINEVLELENFTRSHNTWVNATTWRGMTDEEIRDALEAEFLHSDEKRNWQDDLRVARAIEATLRSKNA